MIRFDYDKLKRKGKSHRVQYLITISGYSRQQLTRLISQPGHGGTLTRHQRTINRFDRRYINDDIQPIAQLDELHDQPNGYALKKLCQRAYCFYLINPTTSDWQSSQLATFIIFASPSSINAVEQSIQKLNPKLLILAGASWPSRLHTHRPSASGRFR